jgi:hypothetical protein
LACAFNTMNRKLTVSYTLPRDAATSIELYTMQGNRIRTLASGPLQKGGHSAAYNVRGLAEGMYIVSLRSGSLCARTRISIIKQ